MNIKILLFAHLREQLGFAERVMQLQEGAQAEHVIAELFAGREDLKRLAPSLMLAVNRCYAERSSVLRDGDEVAVIPPVAGG